MMVVVVGWCWGEGEWWWAVGWVVVVLGGGNKVWVREAPPQAWQTRPTMTQDFATLKVCFRITLICLDDRLKRLCVTTASLDF